MNGADSSTRRNAGCRSAFSLAVSVYRDVVGHVEQLQMSSPALVIAVVIAKAGNRIGGRGTQFSRVEKMEGRGDRGLEVQTLHRWMRTLGPIREEHGGHRSAVLVQIVVGFPLHAAGRQSRHRRHHVTVFGPLVLALVSLVVPSGPGGHIVLGGEDSQEYRSDQQNDRGEREYHPRPGHRRSAHQPHQQNTGRQHEKIRSRDTVTTVSTPRSGHRYQPASPVAISKSLGAPPILGPSISTSVMTPIPPRTHHRDTRSGNRCTTPATSRPNRDTGEDMQTEEPMGQGPAIP